MRPIDADAVLEEVRKEYGGTTCKKGHDVGFICDIIRDGCLISRQSSRVALNCGRYDCKGRERIRRRSTP